MQQSQRPQRIGGNTFHVGDCRIWAEIYYLDSSTNYREYLPQHSSLKTVDELQMLDDRSSPISALKAGSLIRILLTRIRALLSFRQHRA
jgi:hypothetical protein